MKKSFLALALTPILLIGAAGFAIADSHALPSPPPLPGATPPPLPPQPTGVQMKIYVSINGQVAGPFNRQELEAKIQTGELTRRTFVWQEGMADWQQAQTVQVVANLFTGVPQQPAFDARAFMLGTWAINASSNMPTGEPYQVNGSTTYNQDGSLTGFGTMTIQGQYGNFSATITTKGRWSVEPKTDNTFILKTNGSMTMQSSQGSQMEMMDESALYTVIDRNTLASQDGTRVYRTGN